MGLVTEVVPAADLAGAAAGLAASIAANPPWAVQGTLRAIWAAQDLGPLGARSIATALLSTATDKDALRSGTEQFTSGGRVEPRIR
jgi:enoyl-CoA hydratase/carnithine racemase